MPLSASQVIVMFSLSLSDGSQDAFELYYSETYSESSSLSLQDSRRSLASVSDGGDSNPALLLMQEYMITVSVQAMFPTMIYNKLTQPL